jgi:ligand-binding SRPBCC domain-containing protein
VGEGFLAEVCSRWEKGLFKGPSEIRKVALRIGVVLGRQGGAVKEMLPIFQNSLGGPLGSGNQWMSWIHVDDLVSLIIFSLESTKVRGVINAVAPAPVTNRDFTKALANSLGVKAIFKAPSIALRTALGEMSEVLLSSQRVSNKKILNAGFAFKFSNLESAFQDLLSPMKNSARVFDFAQYIDSPVEEVFKFFSDEKNLETLTPDSLNFHIVSKSTPHIEAGTLINYKLKIHGVPANWQTEIIDWQPNKQFIDIQKKGPYSLWHHVHRFRKMGEGTYMEDQVSYKLPMGLIGRLTAGAIVEKDVSKIFLFRRSQIKKLFPYKN